MAPRDMYIQIASLPDREKPVAELWFNDAQWGEVSQQGGDLVLELYPNPSGQPWSFRYEDALALLQQAGNELVGHQ